MRFPHKKLSASGGDLYGHLFENKTAGVPRGIYWNLSIDFKSIKHGDEEFECSFACEWMEWPIKSWRELDGQRLDTRSCAGSPECSFYMTEHDPALWATLAFKHLKKNRFSVDLESVIDFHGYFGGDENPKMPIKAVAEVEFTGILVVPENLEPKPTTDAKILAAVQPFIDLTVYNKPVPWKSHASILRPIIG